MGSLWFSTLILTFLHGECAVLGRLKGLQEADQQGVLILSRSPWPDAVCPLHFTRSSPLPPGEGTFPPRGVTAWGQRALPSPDLPFGRGSVTCLRFQDQASCGVSLLPRFPLRMLSLHRAAGLSGTKATPLGGTRATWPKIHSRSVAAGRQGHESSHVH